MRAKLDINERSGGATKDALALLNDGGDGTTPQPTAELCCHPSIQSVKYKFYRSQLVVYHRKRLVNEVGRENRIILYPFCLDLSNECLWQGSRSIKLRPKAFAAL